MMLVIQWCNSNQGFLSAVLSFIAVLAAIGIPAFIAHRQNKIALFEKKFETYCEIQKVICFAESIKNSAFVKHPSEQLNFSQVFDAMKKPSAILYSMAIVFGFQFNESMDKNEKHRIFLSEIKHIEQRINKYLFLFPYIKPTIIQDMITTFQNYIYYVINVSDDLSDIAKTGGDDETARAFITACTKFNKLCESEIEKDLLL